MFLHRVKMNWKKHQSLTLTILLVALAQIVLEDANGEAPFGRLCHSPDRRESASCNGGLGVPQNLLGIGDRPL